MDYNFMEYFAKVAPVVFLAVICLYKLWNHYTFILSEHNSNSMENLSTLKDVGNALERLNDKIDDHLTKQDKCDEDKR